MTYFLHYEYTCYTAMLLFILEEGTFVLAT